MSFPVVWAGEGNKDNPMVWEVVCWPKQERGLGLGNLILKNISIIGKWLCVSHCSLFLYDTKFSKVSAMLIGMVGMPPLHHKLLPCVC